MDSLALGQLVQPSMEKLAQRIPRLRCALLCTPDGFNICSLGVTENQLGKLAALTSSLVSVGEAMSQNLQNLEHAPAPMDALTIDAGTLRMVGLKLQGAGGSHLFLLASAENVPLGVLLINLQATAAEIGTLLTG